MYIARRRMLTLNMIISCDTYTESGRIQNICSRGNSEAVELSLCSNFSPEDTLFPPVVQRHTG